MRYFYFSRLCVFLLSMITCIENFCQSLYPPKIQSPNAASLGTYGECPINLFNGMPDISVPVYTLSYGKINIPIWLRYNAAAVKPAQQPGWVGSGWDLDCGGAITRQKHGKVDEWYVNNYAGSNPDAMSIKAYYPFPATSQQANSNFGSYYANLPYSWGSPSQLANDFFVNTYNDPYSGTLTSSPSLDPEADEFSFNALGHSGKFYYEGSSGWKVVSDEDIKVEVIDFFSPSEVVNGITEHVNSSGYQGCMYPSPSNAYQSRMFGSFRLTMPDGTKYIFGGRHGYNPPNGYCCPGDAPDAVEMSSPRGLAQDQSSLDLVFEINTWYLKTIIDPNGAQVSFSYINRYPTTTKFYQVDKSAGIAYNSGNNMSYSNGTDYDKYLLAENMQWPVYLNKILTPTEIMNFKMSNAVCNRYTQKQLTYANFSDNSSLNNATALEGVLLGSNCLFDPNVYLNNIQWQKLDSIVVTDNSYAVALYQNQPVITNKFAFTYSNSATQRLMLGSFQKLDKNSSSVEKYQFYYNSDLVTQSPNLHSDGNYTDHWGYYNGVDLPIDFPSVPMSKAPNPNVCTTELLNKIVYPTAGATVLTWESNDYSQIVSTDRQSLIPWSPGIFGDNTLTGVGGGNRIAEIKNVGSDGALLTDKKYYYKNGYTAGANISALTS